MKFLLDVHIAMSIGRALAEQGHDVMRASDAHADWPDSRLLDLAVRGGREVVTEDRDFRILSIVTVLPRHPLSSICDVLPLLDPR